MQVKITNPVGAFTDATGRMVAPKKGEVVEVSDAMGAAMIEAEAAEEPTVQATRKASRAKSGPEETR